MKKNNLIIFAIGLPIFFESLDSNDYSLELFGPYSIAKLIFIVFGFFGLLYSKYFLKSKLVLSYFIIIIGSIVASFTLLDPFPSLSRSIGTFILFISSLGWISFWKNKYFLNYFNFFVIVNFFYWSFYLIDLVYNNGTFSSYSFLFSQIDGVLNHHLVALPISISSIYLLHRYFIYNNIITRLGFMFIFLTLMLLVLSESRSNLLFYFFFIIITYVALNKSSFRSSFLIFTTFFIFSYLYEYFFSSYERIYTRFNLFDLEYQTITSQIRIAAIKSFPVEFSKNLLGTGPLEAKVYIFEEYFNLHNNYLTLILSGGLISLYGVISYLKRIFKIIKYFIIHIYDYESKYTSLIFLIMLYIVTLFSIEIGDLFYYIILSGVFYLDLEYENIKLRINDK